MRTTTIFALACLTVSHAAFAQVYTTPVGYTTQTLKAGQYNLIGLNVHGTTVFSGILNSKPTSTSIADTEATFTSSLASGVNIIEITGSGPNSGAIQEFTTFTATEIQGLPSSFVAALAGDEPYRIRPAATLSSIFGATNQSGLLGGNSNTADLILIPNGSGGFTSYFYSTGGFAGIGWRKVGGGSTNFAADPIVYTDAIFIQRRGLTDLDLVLNGEVKLDQTKIGIAQTYEYISTVFGSAPTLATSGLAASVLQGNSNTADLIMMPNGSGGYLTYFYSNGGFAGVGWRLVGGGSTNQAAVPLTPAIIINRRQSAYNVTLTANYL